MKCSLYGNKRVFLSIGWFVLKIATFSTLPLFECFIKFGKFAVFDNFRWVVCIAWVSPSTSNIDDKEVNLSAERRMGEMLKEMPKATGNEYGGKQKKIDGNIMQPSMQTPTLAEIGIEIRLK